MRFTIPTNKIEKLSKIIKRYQKKGAHITFELGEEVIEDGTLYFEDARTHIVKSEGIKVKCQEVFVEGSYKINDWCFLGTIQFTERGNIIRLADSSFEGQVPEKYLHTPQICEHCGTIRNRKDTYLIYNEKTNEFKQVGSKCLLEYTRGLDAEECASIMSCLDKFASLSNKDYSEDEFFGNGYSSTGAGFSSDIVKKHAIALINRYGYTRMQDGVGSASDLADFLFRNSSDDIWNERFGELTIASDEEVKAIDKYAEQFVESENQYMRNASLAWLNSCAEYRDFGLICSFVYTYNKEMSKVAQNASKSSSEYQGNIGDRITINVVSAKVLYTKEPYSYYGSCSYVQELIDDNGNVYIWSSQNVINLDDNFKENGCITVTGTVKDHKDYKGIKQTVLTRCKY